MPELGSLGSVRGALRNERPYREYDRSIGPFAGEVLVTLARVEASGTELVPGRAIPEINKTIGEVDWDGKTVWEWGGDKAPGGAAD